MAAYVLTCFRVYGNLQDEKLVKYMPKNTDFVSPES